MVLLANKCDLVKEGFCQDKAKMDKYCEEHGKKTVCKLINYLFLLMTVALTGFIGWFETSAKDSIGIDEAAKVRFLFPSVNFMPNVPPSHTHCLTRLYLTKLTFLQFLVSKILENDVVGAPSQQNDDAIQDLGKPQEQPNKGCC